MLSIFRKEENGKLLKVKDNCRMYQKKCLRKGKVLRVQDFTKEVRSHK